MNKDKQTIEESLYKIKFMMNYDSSRTLTEQFKENTSFAGGEPISPTVQNMAGTPAVEVTDGQIKQGADRLNNYYQSYIQALNSWKGRTYQGGDAMIALQNEYKKQFGTELPFNTSIVDIDRPQPLKGPVDVPKPAKQWPFSKGTEEDKYRYGTQGSGIAQVQQNMGLVQDGIWGPKTQAKMQELAPEYVNGFTNQNLPQVIQTVRGQVNTPTADTSNIKRSTSFTPAQNTAQLAGNTTKPRA